MNLDSRELWSQLDLGPNNPNPGGGILYALRLEYEKLVERQANLIDSIIQAGGEISQDVDGNLTIDFSKVAKDNMDAFAIIVEELGVTNEAIMHAEEGVTPMPIETFVSKLKLAYWECLTKPDIDLVDLYDYVDEQLPLLARNILVSNRRDGVLSASQEKLVRGLGYFASYQAKKLDCGFAIK